MGGGDKRGTQVRAIRKQLHELIDEELDYIPIKHNGPSGYRSVQKIVKENDFPVEVVLVREQVYAIRRA